MGIRSTLHQRIDGAIYLFGYAAEMWLKAVCLRLRGGGPNLQVKAALGPLKAFMGVAAPHIGFAGYHDLVYLAECVSYLRTTLGRPLSPVMAAELRLRAGDIQAEWIVDMRYRRTAAKEADAWPLLVNVWWFKNNWVALT